MNKIITVNLPDIGEGVVEGEVIEWLKQEGDPLQQDEPVVIVMTDKATVELPAPYPGKLAKQHHQPGELANLDKPLYDIEVAAEIAPKEKEAKPEPVKEVVEKAPAEPSTVHRPSPGKKALATPPVRKLAHEMGMDINTVSGTGKDGRVLREDLRSPQTPQFSQFYHLPNDEEQPIFGIRGLMAKKTAESKRVIPHFSYFEQVDVSRLIQLRSNVKKEAAEEGVKVTFMPFFIRALALTINEYPMVNCSVDESASRLTIHKQYNIGIAMNSRQGLIVPVLKNVQGMSLAEIIRSFENLKEIALAGKLKSSDMKEATITISNYGVLGCGQWATPVISHPEVAILAINKIQKQPVVKNNQLAVCDVLNLSWSFDHRIIDGDIAAHVSYHFANLLKNPALML